jgi:hypothetical protein
MRDFGLPDHHEAVGQIDTEKDDSPGSCSNVGSVKQCGQKETQHNCRNSVGRHEGED